MSKPGDKPAFYNGSERTDYAEFKEETQNDRQPTVADPNGNFVGPDVTPNETEDEGWARVHGVQEVPDELRGLSQPSDTPLPNPDATDEAFAKANKPDEQNG